MASMPTATIPNGKPHASIISVDASVWLLEGLFRLLLSCVAFASLIYCYHFAAQHAGSFVQGTLVILIASVTNLPMGLYQLMKGVYLLLKALMDIVLAANESLATWEEGGAKQGSTSLESAPHLWVSDEAWLSHFSIQSELDLAQFSLVPNTLMDWKDLPYPKYLNDMLATSLLFHRIYSGTEILPPNLARHVQQADVWLIRMLLLASAANLSLFWLGTNPWRWLPIGILVATVAQILRWIWIQTLATNMRARMLGCYKTPIFWISQRILRKRLILLLTQPFGGPYAYLKKVRENGDAAARISSLFRLPPIVTTIFLFLPLATWAANLVPMITGRWSVALPLGAAAMSLIAAFFFFLLHKISVYRQVNIQQFPANIWVFRYFADTIRRMYGG